MLFWAVLAAMTGAAVLAVLWPLSRSRRDSSSERAGEVAVYRDQLAEIERDVARGVLRTSEAEAARVEVSRRLLAADAARTPRSAAGSVPRRRIAAIASLAGIPLLAFVVYGALGSPDLDAARSARFSHQAELATMVKTIEANLARNPEDGRGWEVVVPYYLSVGRNDDALTAQQNALRLLGPSAHREASLGEVLVAVAKGTVTPEARTAFDRAIVLDQRNAKALFFLGLAAWQAERKEEARENWQRAIQAASPDDRWASYARDHLERLGQKP